jgi:hypothetical protein
MIVILLSEIPEIDVGFSLEFHRLLAIINRRIVFSLNAIEHTLFLREA